MSWLRHLSPRTLWPSNSRRISKQKGRGAITLYFAPLVGLMAAAIAAFVAYEVWWFNQPTVPLDINTATVRELTTLSGVDAPLAEKIIVGRPYERKDELVQKQIIPQATYEQIKDKIVAKQK